MVIDFHPAASDEAEAAHRWYAERSSIAAARFREELDAAVADIQTDPELWCAVLARNAMLPVATIPIPCRLPSAE